jgi:hypothetical protein
MPPEGMGTVRGNCGFLDVSTILSRDRSFPPASEADVQVLTTSTDAAPFVPEHR